MRTKIVCFVGGLLAAISLGVLAQSSGIPSRLRLQGLFVQNRDMGYSSGNYTGAVVGCTTNPAPFVVWQKFGGIVSLQFQPFSCTSNSGIFRITGAPAALRGTANTSNVVVHCINNTVNAPGSCEMYMGPSGSLEFAYLGSSFTSAGTKGIGFSGGSVGYTYSTQW